MHKKSFLLIGILLLTAIQISAAAPIVVDDGESAPAVWDKKVNCTLQRVTDHPQAGAGALRLRLDLTQFNFGWCFRSLPAANYAAARGIHFFARVPEGSDCQVRLQLILPGANEVSYLGSSPLRVSGPEWQELYVPFSDLRLERGPAVAFKPTLLSPDVRLQLTVEGATGKNAVFDFDNISLLQGAEAEALAQRFRRMQTNRLLLPEDPAWAKAHPRLLLSSATLPAIRRRVATGVPAQALARLRAEADQVCDPAAKGYMDPDKLFAGLTPIMAQPNSHELSGRLEGVVVSNTGPIERMAFLYQVTGEKRYGEQGARLLVAAARRLPADDPAWSKAFYYTRTFQVRALAFGYDWLYERLTPMERQEVKAALLEYARDIYEHSLTDIWTQTELGRVWNWAPGLMASAGLALMAIENETQAPDRQWLFRCERVVSDYLTFGVDEDGAGIEGPNYLGYGMGAAPEFMAALRARGNTDLVATTHFRRSPAWMLEELLPDGTRWNNLSDGGYQSRPYPSYTYLFGRMAEAARTGDPMPGSPALRDFRLLTPMLPDADRPPLELSPAQSAGLLAWWWEHACMPGGVEGWSQQWMIPAILWYPEGVTPIDPESVLPLAMHFRGRGLVYLRTGWKPDDIVFSLEAGPYTAMTHDQADKGQFTLYGYGEDLAIDSGYGNDGDKQKSTSSFAHNVVLIDGEGEAFRGGHSQSDGWIADFWPGAGQNYVRVDEKPAYESYYDSRYTRLPNRKMQKAERQVLFVRDAPQPYFILCDDIQADARAHTYDWLLHVPASRGFQVDGKRIITRAVPDTETYVRTPVDGSGQNGRLDFAFTVAKPGRYVVWARTRAGGPDPGKSDSFYIQMDGGTEYTWDLSSGAGWTWDQARSREEALQVLVFDLKAGAHTLSIYAREPNAQMERIWIAPATAPEPRGLTPQAEGSFLFQAEAGKMVTKGFEVVQPGSAVAQTRASLDINVVSPQQWTSAVEEFITSKDGAHPRLKVTTNAVNPHFLMLLYPRRAGAEAPVVTSIPAQGGVALEARWGAVRELCAFRTEAGAVSAGSLSGDARVLFYRAGTPAAFTMVDGASLRVGGTELVSVSGGRATAALSDGRLVLRGPSGARVRVKAAGIRSVTINDRPAALAAAGEWTIP